MISATPSTSSWCQLRQTSPARGSRWIRLWAPRAPATSEILWRASGRARAPMKLVCGDAVEFPLPEGPCLAFLFNPFGAPVMRRLLAAWKKSLSKTFAGRMGQLDILYVNNEQERVLERQAGF